MKSAVGSIFRRCKAGEEPGYPRFKGYGRYDSFTFPQSGFSITHDNRVCLSKIGSIEMVYHRPIQVGIDVGLKSFATLSTGAEIANPRFFRKEEKALAKVQRKHVNRMTHNHCLAKSIADASWSAFFAQLSSKAEEAGRAFVKVNPAYTSQTCNRCGHRQKMPLDVRIFACPCCFAHLDRDLNAALNIRAVGLHSLGLSLEAPVLRRGE